MRPVLAFFLVFILVCGAIMLVGERYGRHKPTPGRSGPIIVCDQYYHCRTQ